jgi:pimeloyl-ACP methyl ester carboxylesterase
MELARGRRMVEAGDPGSRSSTARELKIRPRGRLGGSASDYAIADVHSRKYEVMAARFMPYSSPLWVVAGECSPLPRQAAESTAAAFPDARLTIVAGAGHQVWYEAPGCMAKALSRVAARLA